MAATARAETNGGTSPGQAESKTIEVPPMETIERDDFVAAMGQAATGVTVVTTSNGIERLGVTVSSMSSVSADPPLLLVCVHRRSPVCDNRKWAETAP